MESCLKKLGLDADWTVLGDPERDARSRWSSRRKHCTRWDADACIFSNAGRPPVAPFKRKFRFNTNNALVARSFFQGNKSRFVRNEYGGTVGGPIYIPGVYDGRNRSFFFFNYNRLSRRSAPSSSFITLPTGLNQVGNFSDIPETIYDPATTRADPAGPGFIRDPFPGNIIPTDRLSPAAVLISHKVYRQATAMLFPGPVENLLDRAFGWFPLRRLRGYIVLVLVLGIGLVDSGMRYEALSRMELPENSWYLVQAAASYPCAPTCRVMRKPTEALGMTALRRLESVYYAPANQGGDLMPLELPKDAFHRHAGMPIL